MLLHTPAYSSMDTLIISAYSCILLHTSIYIFLLSNYYYKIFSLLFDIELRKAVRSSIMRSTPRSHEHSYAPEIYSPDDDVWTKTCTECGHQISYEKM